MRAMMLFGREKEGTRLDASDGDRVIALMLSYNVAGAPIVKTAIRNGRMKMQVMWMHSNCQEELVGMAGPRLEKFDLDLRRCWLHRRRLRLFKRSAKPGKLLYTSGHHGAFELCVHGLQQGVRACGHIADMPGKIIRFMGDGKSLMLVDDRDQKVVAASDNQCWIHCNLGVNIEMGAVYSMNHP
jgi:hypothetical protein